MKTPLQIIEERLKDHDYTYENSDDHRYWVNGTKDEAEITILIKNHLTSNPEDLHIIESLIIKYRVEYGTNFMKAIKEWL